MYLLLYISKREYGQGYLAQKTNENSYAVGYHGFLGEETTDTPASNNKPGTQGYGSGALVTPTVYMEGCVQSQDGDKALLELILSIYETYSPSTMTVAVADQYLIRVTQQWMQTWTTAAIKGNHQAVHQGDLWLKVRDKGVHFITHLEGDIGDDLANVYSVSYAPWEYTSPAKDHINKPAILPSLLWTTMYAHFPNQPVNNRYFIANTKEIYELGNMSPDTIYGIVHLPTEVPILRKLTDFIDEVGQNGSATVIRLRNIAVASTGSAIARHATSVLAKPHRWTDSYSLGLDVPIIEEINPAHKFYVAQDMAVILSTLLDYLCSVTGTLETKNDALSLKDVTGDLIINGKPSNALLSGALSINLRLANGRSTNFSTSTELPPLNTIRATAKLKGHIYIGHYNVNGIYRYIYVIQSAEGIGIYTPWITKLEFI